MAASASASVSLQITVRDALNAGLAHGVIPTQFNQILELNNGLTDAGIDMAWSASPSGVAASAVTVYDLAGGSLSDRLGNALTFAEVVLIAICNKRLTALAYLDFGPAVATGFGRLAASKGFWPADIAADADQGSIVGPGGWLCLYDPTGIPVGPGTTDLLRVTASAVAGNVNEWDILVLGRSA